MNPVKFLNTPAHWIFLAVAVLLRILLGFYSPSPHGYVYDFYAKAVEFVVNTGGIPTAGDCFICYHPPLLPLVGAGIFKLVAFFGGSFNSQHYWLASLTGVCSVIYCLYSYGIYRQYASNRFDYLIWGLLLVLPVVFISSFSIESDLLAAMFIVMALYYFGEYQAGNSVKALILAAAFSGLAALTKYSGLVICVILGGFLFYHFVRQPSLQTLFRGLLFACVCALLGAYPYVNNLIKHNTPFAGNEAWHMQESYADIYQYTDFDIPAIVEVMGPDAKPGILNEFPAYNTSVLTSLYGQLWTDFSFFSVPGRHGHAFGRLIYPYKDIPQSVIWMVLICGLIPCFVSFFGGLSMLWRRQQPLLLVTGITSIVIYLDWMSGFNLWMIKTKYLMYLLPIWMLMIQAGLKMVSRHWMAMITLWPSVIASILYGFYFAVS